MKKIYISDNYIIFDIDGSIKPFPMRDSLYDESVDAFQVTKHNGNIEVPYARVGSYYDSTGLIPYTTATLREFLRKNTNDPTESEAIVNLATNDLGRDAWGRPKTITDKSLFHGLFTKNIPVGIWKEEFNDYFKKIKEINKVRNAIIHNKIISVGRIVDDNKAIFKFVIKYYNYEYKETTIELNEETDNSLSCTSLV